MQKIAFIVQDLSNRTDSVANDCIFQFRALREQFAETTDVRLFAEMLPDSLAEELGAVDFKEFFDFIDEHPDALVIYHFCDGWPAVDPLLGEQIKNVIVRWHNNTPPWFYALESYEFASGCLRGFEVMTQFARKRAIRFMVNSEFSARQLEALGARRSHIRIVYPGSQILEKDLLPPKGKLINRDSAGISLLFVGRVVPHKGHRHVLSVAHAVQRFTNTPVSVVFVGSLEKRLEYYWSELIDVARELGVELELKGSVDNKTLSDCYTSADVFVCLSEHEGFGLPVFEAMHSSLPVVVWSSSAFKELLVGHPLASEAFDVCRFAACVCRAMEAETRESVLAEQMHFLERYNLELVRRQVVSAVMGGPDFTVGQRSIGEAGRLKSLSAEIDVLADEIEEGLGDEVRTFLHDAPQNLVSQYDLASYRVAIEGTRLEAERAGRVPIFVGVRAEEIHPGANVIQAALAGDVAQVDVSIDQISRFDDEVFLKLAYKVTGREKELWRYRKHLHRLRQGFGKREILDELLGSSHRTSNGKKQLPARTPRGGLQFGGLFRVVRRRMASGGWFETDAERLQRIEETISRIGRAISPKVAEVLSSNPMGAIHDVYDLLRLNDPDFVSYAYRLILGRKGDPGGLSFYLGRLRNGEARSNILKELAASPEGAGRVSLIDGLSEVISELDREQSNEHKVLGSHNLIAHRRRLMRLENEVGRIAYSLIDNLSDRPVQSVGHAVPRLVKRDSVYGAALATDKSIASSARTNTRSTIERIHQIYITENGRIPDEFPAAVERNIASIKRMHPNATYKMWGLPELRDFIQDNFSNEVVDAFDSLQAFAFKADLGRYCLLYKLGGLYSDLSNLFLNPLQPREGCSVAFFREHKPLHGAAWMMQNSIIYSEPEQPELRLAIELVVANVQNKDYGVSSLAPSGPVLFGRAFAIMNRSDVYQVGEAINLQVDGGLNRACYVGNEGSLVAVRMQGGGGRPDELGLRGTNVYGHLWEKGLIYSEKQFCFSSKHPALRSPLSGGAKPIFVKAGHRGNFLHGPYVELPRGSYEAIVCFRDVVHPGGLVVDIACQGGEKVIARTGPVKLDEENRIAISFITEEKEFDVEVRAFSEGEFSATVDSVTVRLRGETDTRLVVPPVIVPSQSVSKQRDPVEHIHHIIGTDEVPLNAELRDNLDAALGLHQGAARHIWTMSEVRQFIADSFQSPVLDAFDSLGAMPSKVELAKLCLLYKVGGLYVDVGITTVNPIMLSGPQGIVCFRAARVRGGSPWSIDTRMIFSLPEQSELYDALSEIVTSARSKPAAIAAGVPVAGHILGKCLAVGNRAENYASGEAVRLTEGFKVQNVCYLGSDGRLMGVRMNDGPMGTDGLWMNAHNMTFPVTSVEPHPSLN